jgi:hypothetical protein
MRDPATGRSDGRTRERIVPFLRTRNMVTAPVLTWWVQKTSQCHSVTQWQAYNEIPWYSSIQDAVIPSPSQALDSPDVPGALV